VRREMNKSINKNAHITQYCEENVDELKVIGEQQVETEGG
jgi:hypothetical protein